VRSASLSPFFTFVFRRTLRLFISLRAQSAPLEGLFTLDAVDETQDAVSRVSSGFPQHCAVVTQLFPQPLCDFDPAASYNLRLFYFVAS
jgi:hypothetical protein